MHIGLKKILQLFISLNKSEKKQLTDAFVNYKLDPKQKKLFDILIKTSELFEGTDNLPAAFEESLQNQLYRAGIVTTRDGIQASTQISKIYPELEAIIFEILLFHHLEKKHRIRLYKLLAKIEYLFRKKMFAFCLSEISEANELAEKLEDYPSQLTLITYKRRIIVNTRLNIADYQNELKKLQQKESEIVTYINTFNLLAELYVETLLATWNKQLINLALFEEKLDKIKTQKTIFLENTFEFNNYFLSIERYKITLSKDSNEEKKLAVLKIHEKLEDIYNSQQYKTIIENDNERYIAQAQNFAQFALLNDVKNIFPMANLEKYLNENKKNLNNLDLVLAINIYNMFDLDKKDWVLTQKRLKNINQDIIIKKISDNRKNIVSHHIITYSYNFLLLNLITENIDNALSWSNLMLSFNYKEINIEFIVIARYIKILIFTKTNHEEVEALLHSTKEYAKNHQHYGENQKVLNDVFLSYFTVFDKKQRKEKLIQLKEKLKSLIQYETNHQTYHIFLAWLDAEIEQKTLMETISRYL